MEFPFLEPQPFVRRQPSDLSLEPRVLWVQDPEKSIHLTFVRRKQPPIEPLKLKAVILQMVAKSISRHFETMVDTIVCWHLQGIIIPGFLRNCRISSIHGNVR